jgi:hypothetical protein
MNRITLKQRFITKLIEQIKENVPRHMLIKGNNIVDAGVVI